jgi:drug/metabolite transporter (DMT)-like permease
VSETDPKPQVLKAALWMTGAIASFSSMAVAGREISGIHDTFEMMLFRSVIGMIIVSLVISLTRKWGEVTTRSMGTQVLRNAAHFTGQNLWFFAVALIPLAQVFALEFTTPIWVIVLAPLVLGERLTRLKALAAVTGFIGILIVARPSPETINAGVLTAASSAIFFAFTLMLTSKLTRTETIACILFWMTVLQAIMGLIAVAYDGAVTWPTLQTLPWLVVIGFAGLLAHFCITNALAIAPATIVVPFDFARLPVIFVVGWALYNEPLDIWVAAGALIIFAAIYLNVWSQTRKNRVV